MTFLFLNYLWIAIALATLLSLVAFKVRAPYGRHSSGEWGPVVANKWGWVLMELPALLIMPIVSFSGPSPKTNLTFLLVGLWILHYVYRTLIFPFKIKTKHKKIPVIIVLSAVFFNGINGLLNGYFLGYINTSFAHLNTLNVFFGLLIFFVGMYVNRSSDQYLISLREKQSGYQLPRGGLFESISCPNHFGEIVEWLGFAIIAWNLSAVTFVIWTACNLIPRALNHHSWYKDQFNNYPESRKAIFPKLL